MDFFDAEFPGNLSVAQKLQTTMQNEEIVCFTGAGTSMPAMPSWNKLTEDLINDAQKEGKMSPETAKILLKDESDLLFSIDEVYNASGEKKVKSKVSNIFLSLKEPTECHKLLVKAKIKKFITLNYDTGIEKAFSKIYSMHVSSAIPTPNHFSS